MNGLDLFSGIGGRGVRIIFQNLNEAKEHLIHFRGWLRLDESYQRTIRFEFVTKPSFAVDYEIDPGDAEHMVKLGLLFFTLYIGLEGLMPKWFYPKGWEAKHIGIRVHDWKIWLDLWTPTMSWTRGQRSYTFDILKFLFGKEMYATKSIFVLEPNHKLVMPEGEYETQVRMEHAYLWRSRIPTGLWMRKCIRAHVDCPKGVPVPGKGENSWDCGDDAYFGQTCSIERPDPKLALQNFVQSINETRSKYGSGPGMYLKKATP